jgi:hypothetical protein
MREHPLRLLLTAPARLIRRVPPRHPVCRVRPGQPDTTASVLRHAATPLRIGCNGQCPLMNVMAPPTPADPGLLNPQVSTTA